MRDITVKVEDEDAVQVTGKIINGDGHLVPAVIHISSTGISIDVYDAQGVDIVDGDGVPAFVLWSDFYEH